MPRPAPPRKQEPTASLPARLLASRRQYTREGASNENRRIGAALALLTPNHINRIANGLKSTISKNGVKNTSKINTFSRAFKNSLPSRPGGPITSRNQVKNAAILAMSSYLSQKIGYTQNTNTMLINNLLLKLIRLRTDLELATNQPRRRAIGEQIGRILGQLVMSYTQIMKSQTFNNRKVNIGKGALKGFLDQVVGGPLAVSVMGTIDGINAFHKFTSGIKF